MTAQVPVYLVCIGQEVQSYLQSKIVCVCLSPRVCVMFLFLARHVMRRPFSRRVTAAQSC